MRNPNLLRLKGAIAAFTEAHGRVPTVLFDADGVLYEWEGGPAGFVQTHRNKFPHITIGDAGTRDRFGFFMDAPDEERDAALEVLAVMDYSALELMPGAVRALHAVREAGADVNVCTAPTLDNPNCEAGKKAAIIRDFGHEVAERTFIMRDKTYALGDILIDDKPAVTGRRTPTWEHVRYAQLYNVGLPGARIENWVDGSWVDILTDSILELAVANEVT